MDGEIFKEPEKWKGGRFIGEQKLKDFVMPFGGGASKCPGRMFAVREVKVFVVEVRQTRSGEQKPRAIVLPYETRLLPNYRNHPHPPSQPIS
jgi:cytochrome P450